MALHSRVKRINEELKMIIAEIIQNDIKDPRLNDVMVTVTHVDTSRDLSQAQVFVSVFGNDDQIKSAKQALDGSHGFIRHEVASKITFRYMPELIFKLDETGRNAAKINDVLRKIEKQNPDAFVEPPPEENDEEDK